MSRTIRIRAAGFLIACLGLLVAACGSSSVQVADPPNPSPRGVAVSKTRPRNFEPSSFNDVNSPETVKYAPSLKTEPVRAGTAAKVSRARALAAAAKTPFGKELQPGEPAVALRMVTIGEEAFGTKTSLAWVLVWANSKPDVKGPVGVSPAERDKIAASMSCVFVIVVDATTNEVLDSRQVCRGI
jgi:hypothetical protein